jgi:sulfide:quinone oxidoreductase
MATVAVLGGSFGGVTTAYELQEHLIDAGMQRKHEVVLISDRPTFTFRPALPWLLGGHRRPEDITFDLSEACRRRGISFIHGHVISVDANKKCVTLGTGNLFYDQAVLAVGVRPLYSQTPGLRENSYSPLWVEDTVRFRQALKHFKGGPAVIGTTTARPWPCPAYEVLSFLVDKLEREGNLGRARITFITAEPAFMFYGGPGKAPVLARMAAANGVNILANVTVKRVTEGEVFLSNGARLPSELTMVLPPMGPQEAIVKSAGIRKDRLGFVEADRDMRALRHEDRDGLWVLGDCVSFEGLKNGRNAELQGRVAAHNIARKLRAVRGRPRRYISEYFCLSRFGPGKGLMVWTRPAPQQGYPKRVKASALGRWPYFVKIGFEKVWLARHN